MAFTFFFRDRETLEAAVEQLVPRAMGRSRIRVWDAGCAAGEEAYTIAMMLAERLGPHAISNLRIDATDHEESSFPRFAGIISSGIYEKANVDNVPEEYFKRYLAPCADGNFEVSGELRKRVVFTRHDLLTCVPVAGDFSLVVCKNVLLHFKPGERTRVVEMFHRSMLPGGLLALDPAQALPSGTEEMFIPCNGGVPVFQKVGD